MSESPAVASARESHRRRVDANWDLDVSMLELELHRLGKHEIANIVLKVKNKILQDPKR